MDCLSDACDAKDARALTISLNVWDAPLWDAGMTHGDDSRVIGTDCRTCGERILRDDHMRVIGDYLVAMTDGMES